MRENKLSWGNNRPNGISYFANSNPARAKTARFLIFLKIRYFHTVWQPSQAGSRTPWDKAPQYPVFICLSHIKQVAVFLYNRKWSMKNGDFFYRNSLKFNTLSIFHFTFYILHAPFPLNRRFTSIFFQ